MQAPEGYDGFIALVPIKPPGLGKSRLAGLDGVDREELATALATDTVRACLATPGVLEVVVVTDSADLAELFELLGVHSCGDGEEPGLNAALRHGAADAGRRWATLLPVALLGDLPALRPTDLRAALDVVAERPVGSASFVADADGTGTTLYAAGHARFDPRFGADSAAAHADAGALAVPGDLTTLRRDVDDRATLEQAVALGVGIDTQRVLGDLLLTD